VSGRLFFLISCLLLIFMHPFLPVKIVLEYLDTDTLDISENLD